MTDYDHDPIPLSDPLDWPALWEWADRNAPPEDPR